MQTKELNPIPALAAVFLGGATLVGSVFACGHFNLLGGHVVPGECHDDDRGPEGTDEPDDASYETFYIGENTLYESAQFDDCENTNTNSLNIELHRALEDNGWRGLVRDDNPNTDEGRAVATDIRDVCFGNNFGQDHMFADGNSLMVFAGHGTSDAKRIQFAYTDPNGRCTASIKDGDVWLGRGRGARARVAIWASSCTGHHIYEGQSTPPNYKSFRRSLGENLVWQHLAFYDSPGLNRDALAVWFNRLAEPFSSNTWTWLQEAWKPIQNDPNRPIVFTVSAPGTPDSAAFDRSDFANLRAGDWGIRNQFPEPPPGSVQEIGPVHWESSMTDIDLENDDPYPTTCVGFVG